MKTRTEFEQSLEEYKRQLTTQDEEVFREIRAQLKEESRVFFETNLRQLQATVGQNEEAARKRFDASLEEIQRLRLEGRLSPETLDLQEKNSREALIQTLAFMHELLDEFIRRFQPQRGDSPYRTPPRPF